VHTIIVPTCKTRDQVEPLLEEIRGTAQGQYDLVATCTDASAAANRNLGLAAARGNVVVMVDDDVTGYAMGWNTRLVHVLRSDPGCVMVSAQLLTADGTPGQMLGNPQPRAAGLQVVPRRELPTACIAIRNDGTRFDERYVGSGWEDTDFCRRLAEIYPDGTFVVRHDVRAVHLNEQKRQGENFVANKRRFEEVWGKHPYF